MTDYIKALSDPMSPYHGEAQRLVAKLWHGETTNKDGVLRWTSNGRVPPADIIALAAHITMPINVAACTKARDEETAAFLAEYRKNNDRQMTAEERFEARATFGKGTTVVNLITGRRTKL